MYHNFNFLSMAGLTFLCLVLLAYVDADVKFLSADVRLPEHEYHLVRCFENVISTYFAKERSILLSIPEVCDDQYKTTNSVETSRSFCKVTDFLFSSIHSYQKYPMLVTGPAFNGTFTNIPLSQKATVFNIILGKGDDDKVFSVFKSELARLSHLPIWNTRGRFIVMCLDRNFPSVNITPEENELTRNVLGELWEKDVVNAIVLVHNVNTNMSTTSVDIHTWFPFAENHCRGPVDRTVVLDHWMIYNESEFAKKAELFPDKMSNFYRCVVTAVTFSHEPFILSMKKTDSNMTEYSGGVEISLLETIAGKLNFTVQYLPEPERKSYKMFTLYDQVKNKQADIGFAGTAYTYHAIDKRDHTVGYVKETVKWFGPLAKPSPRWKSLLIIFTPLMWLVVLAVYFIASLMFWLLANVNRNAKEHVCYTEAAECFLQTFSVVLGEAVFVRPSAWSLRLFFILWVFYCLLINTAYQSSLFNVLTNPQFEPAVDTVEKLLKSDMKYGFVPALKFWYSKVNDAASKQILKNHMPCPTLNACLKRTASTQNFAVCGGGLHLLYLSYEKKYSPSGIPKFIPFKEEVVSYLASMFFRSGSFLLESFNRIIYRAVESGMVEKFWEDIKMQHLGQVEDDDENEEEQEEGDGSDTVVLTVEHLEGAFILLLLGLTLGLTVFVMENLWFRFRQYKNHPLLSPPVSELKSRTFLNYKRHVIHNTSVSRVKKRDLILRKVKT